jgi:hypothetical protein
MGLTIFPLVDIIKNDGEDGTKKLHHDQDLPLSYSDKEPAQGAVADEKTWRLKHGLLYLSARKSPQNSLAARAASSDSRQLQTELITDCPQNFYDSRPSMHANETSLHSVKNSKHQNP